MSRVVLTRHKPYIDEDGDQVAAEHLVVGWDGMLSTYFWQVMGEGDLEGSALKSAGDRPSELATWDMFLSSMKEQGVWEGDNGFESHINWNLRRTLERHADDPESGRIIVDLVEPPSYAAEVFADGEWCGNGVYLKTEDDAVTYGRDLAMASRWMRVREWRVVPTANQPTYEFVDGRFLPVQVTS